MDPAAGVPELPVPAPRSLRPAAPVGVAEDHVVGLDPELSTTSAIASKPGAADRARGEVGAHRAEPEAVGDPDRARARRPSRAASRAPSRRAVSPPPIICQIRAEGSAPPRRSPTVAWASAVEERVDRRLDALVLVGLGGRCRSGGASGSAAGAGDAERPLDRRHPEALDRRHGQVPVEVVAVRRVDVVAQPEARVGEAHLGRRPRARRAPRTRGPRAPRAARARAARRPSSAASLEPGLDQVVVVVAGHDRPARRPPSPRRAPRSPAPRARAPRPAGGRGARARRRAGPAGRRRRAASISGRGSARGAAGRRRCRARGAGRRSPPCAPADRRRLASATRPRSSGCGSPRVPGTPRPVRWRSDARAPRSPRR